MQDLNIKKISDAVAKVTAESLADKVFEEEVTKLVEKTDSCKSLVTGINTFKPALDTTWKNNIVGIDTSMMKSWKPVSESFQALAIKRMPEISSLVQRVKINYGVDPELQRSVSAMVNAYNTRLVSITSQFAEKLTDTFNKTWVENINKSLGKSLKEFAKFGEYLKFLNIADEMKFPIYLENGGELQSLLMESYHRNGDTCNKEEMTQIIMEYFNGDYALRVFESIKSVGIFEKYNAGRIECLKEGFELYEEGRYIGAGSTFVLQLSGMIKDVYEEMCTIHRFTRKEKQELIVTFGQGCSIDSEKSKLLQIISCQNSGGFTWSKIADHFLNVVYCTKDAYVESNPQRHPMCHGEQTNYGTQEMNLKLVMCMDILAELAWRIQDMKAEKKSA